MPISDIKLVTPQDLVDDPEILTHLKSLDETRTPFDGKVGSVVENGHYFVMSPNVGHTYYPPFGKHREVRLRKNFRFAEDDYLCGPQPYLVQFCHLAAIPRQSKDQRDPLALMWWTPTMDNFAVSPTNMISGIGLLEPRILNRFRQLVVPILKRVEDYKNDPTFPEKRKPLVALAIGLDHAFRRLESLHTTFHQMHFGVAQLQRCYLEVKAYLDYLYVYHPMMTGQAPPATSVSRTIGAYVHDPVVVQEFVRAGLPVWVMLPYKVLPTTRIDSWLPPRPVEKWAVVADATPPFKPFFTGSANDPAKYISFGHFARTFVGYPNPFADATPSPSSNVTSTSLDAASRPTRTMSAAHLAHEHAKRSAPYPKQNPKLEGAAPIVGRNKFVEFSSPLMPPSIPAWSKALASVNRDCSRLKTQSLSSDSGYVFPEPGLFVGVANPQKTATFIHHWLRNRPALIYRLSSGLSSARPISPQLWRTLLNYGGVTGGGESLVNDRRRREAADMLGNCVQEEGVELSTAGAGKSLWREQELPLGILPAPQIIQEIFWELFELNFRFEFVALDSRASTLANKDLHTRQLLIADCFPGHQAGSLLVADIEYGGKGLASEAVRDRAPYLLSMLKVTSSWLDLPASLGNIVDKPADHYQERELLALEEELVHFYTQSFFDHFGRAAMVPHRLIRVQPS